MRALALGLCTLTLLPTIPPAGQSPLPETFAFRARATGNNRPVRVEITIQAWAQPMLDAQLYEIVRDHGGAGLRAALQQLPQTAEMRVDAYRSYPLQYAREFIAEDGSRRLLLATHTPIGFQGGEGYFRASAGAFTVIELRVDADGEGDGTAEIAEEVSFDADQRTFGLSGSRAGSVRLSSVRRVGSQ
jgi:hypothetical protein